MRKKTKILATIGPASQSKEVIERLALAGVNAFRLNFSHGSHEYHKETIEKIRRVEAKIGYRIGIFQDICGPKIRVGKLKEPFRLKVGDTIEVHKEEILGGAPRADGRKYALCRAIRSERTVRRFDTLCQSDEIRYRRLR